MSLFVRLADTVSSRVLFTFPSSGVVDLQYEIRTTDRTGGVVVNATNNIDSWRGRGAWAENTNTLTRVAGMSVNGIPAVAGNRQILADLICTGEWLVVRYDGYSRSTFDGDLAFLTGESIEFANYDKGAMFCPVADVRNFKIDLGRTGSWTHESNLGDTNGFSAQDVTILSDIDPASVRRKHAAAHFFTSRFL